MERRGFLGAVAKLAAVAVLPAAAVAGAEPVPAPQSIDGVGVLRFPNQVCRDTPDGPDVHAKEIAEALATDIRKGTCVILPSDRDSFGQYLWDFRVEGGDPKQVLVKRREERPLRVGDRVLCHDPGSWVDGREAVVVSLNVVSSDGIEGHGLRVPGVGVTVVPEFLLERVSG